MQTGKYKCSIILTTAKYKYLITLTGCRNQLYGALVGILINNQQTIHFMHKHWSDILSENS